MSDRTGYAREKVRNMGVCPFTGELFGDWTYGGATYYQACGCDNDEPEGSAPTGFDFPLVAELCFTCGSAVIASGSRWSPFHCADCLPHVRAANETLGRAAIPLGRHSAMNGYGIPASNIDGDAAMKLAAATKVLSSVIDRLYAWRREQVTLYVRQMQPHHNQGVRLSAYLEHVGTFYEPGEAALRMLCRELVADFPSESMGFS